MPLSLLWIDGISIALIGAFSGVLLAATAAISPSLALLDGENYAKVKQCQIKVLQILMTSLSVAYLVAAGIFAWNAYSHSTDASWLSIGAIALVVIALIYSAFTDIPYNGKILKWDPKNLPSDWKEIRSGWDKANAIRTVPALAAFALQIASLAVLAAIA